MGKNLTLFSIFSNGKNTISPLEVKNYLKKNGFLYDDPRWLPCYEALNSIDVITESSFDLIFKSRIAELTKALHNELIITQFISFKEEIAKIFEQCRQNKTGKNASYIPQLERVDPEKYGLGLCTIDGQRFNLGDYDDGFCVQSTGKPITYAIALETLGEHEVHKYVDKEPSGQAFHSMILTADDIPYNPMINAGGIMTCSLVEKGSNSSERFEKVLNWWKRLAGGFKPGFSNSVYLSERSTADRNYALAFFMKSRGGFPKETDLESVLEFYFQSCSIEMTCNSMAIVAATLANGGICPLTHERVLSTSTTKSVLSLMFSCGMYDYSGQFAFSVGLPSKSGISGVILIVIPGCCGLAIWSPRVDKSGNSVRGIEFCKALVKRFNFHNFDNLTNNDNQSKIDPRKDTKSLNQEIITEFLFACMENDIPTVKRMVQAGVNINMMNYDKRTGLHIACSEGHYDLVKFLLDNNADTEIQDRWNNKAVQDAERNNFSEIVEMIIKNSKNKKKEN